MLGGFACMQNNTNGHVREPSKCELFPPDPPPCWRVLSEIATELGRSTNTVLKILKSASKALVDPSPL
jgi:hypothetical protein